MHLKIVVYFLHLVISGVIAGLCFCMASTLFLEGILAPIPLLMTACVVSGAWFCWRLHLQKLFNFSITKTAFKSYLPLSIVSILSMTYGAKELLDTMLISSPRIPYLLYLTGLIAVLYVCARILEFDQMPRKEKISYRRGLDTKDHTSWKRSTGRRIFQT